MAGNLLTYIEPSAYIHSNVENYVAVSQMLFNSDFVLKNNISNIKEEFRRLISKAKIYENQFYDDTNIPLGFDRAKLFSEKYLLLGEVDENSTLIKKIAYILNTEKFKNILIGAFGYEKRLENAINNVFGEEYVNNLFTEITKNENYSEQLLAFTLSLKKGERTRVLEIAGNKFPMTSTATRSFDMKTGEYKLTKAMERYILKNLRFNKIKIKEKIINGKEIKTGTDPKGMVTFAVNYFKDNLKKLKVEPLEKREELGESLKKTLRDILYHKENRIGNIDIFTNPRGATGFVAEIVWSFNTELTSEVVGQVKKEKTGKQGKGDILITVEGKNGQNRYYLLQSKNTFLGRGPMFFSGGKLDTIFEKLQEAKHGTALTEDQLGLLRYNILNTKIFNIGQGLESISILLTGGLLNYIREDTFEYIKDRVDGRVHQTVNLFYVYKGTYLVPFSSFLETVYDLLGKFEGLFQVNMSDIKFNFSQSKQDILWEQKKEIQREYPDIPKGRYGLGYYGEEMLALGHKTGEEISKEASINNIKIFAKRINLLLEQASKGGL